MEEENEIQENTESLDEGSADESAESSQENAEVAVPVPTESVEPEVTTAEVPKIDVPVEASEQEEATAPSESEDSSKVPEEN